MDLKCRLDDEIVKNEHLERSKRAMEFQHLKQVHELNRKIQELETKNSLLRKELQAYE